MVPLRQLTNLVRKSRSVITDLVGLAAKENTILSVIDVQLRIHSPADLKGNPGGKEKGFKYTTFTARLFAMSDSTYMWEETSKRVTYDRDELRYVTTSIARNPGGLYSYMTSTASDR